ncbi:hypothetical protein ACHAXR_012207 [Thalassiosira sp. AJA248-18]
MPALAIFKNFTTRPFGGDDLHIGCLILGFYRLIQFICLAPLCLHYYLQLIRGEDIYVNGIPPWCHQYDLSNILPFFVDDMLQYRVFYSGNGTEYEAIMSFERGIFGIEFVALAVIYFAADITWICMVWSASSLGTPTETNQRDKYLRKLIIFKMFVGNVYPLLLLVFGVRKIFLLREDNYGCGNGTVPTKKPDEGYWYGFFCALLITYALELLIWPAIVANHVMRVLRTKSYLVRIRAEGHERRVERLEHYVGMALRFFQCITCNRADFRNQGELKEFACHFLGIVLSDVYVGLRMLARVQAEEKLNMIQQISAQITEERKTNIDMPVVDTPCKQLGDEDINNPFPHHREFLSNRNSMFVLCSSDNSIFDVCERDVLGSNNAELSLMRDAAHFARYAQLIYSRLKILVVDEFMLGPEVAQFKRDTESLYNREFKLTSIGCEYAMLSYATFENGLCSTPYAILVDEQVKNIVIAVRGTVSLDDMVIDLQYNPASLEKTGQVCGFEGHGHYCHKGFLTRAKWLYNDIKKNRCLKNLASEQSPFKDYPLVLCGHSLGAGCATILSLMLRPKFPSLTCYAYCPPGAIVDDEMAKYCEEFITNFVRQDDMIPRISQKSLESGRDQFLNVISRIKVPKIELFFDVRNPCPDSALSARNANVLRAEEDVSQDSDFYEQLARFRAERNENPLTALNSANLYIAGKIVHLVDTKGDRAYVAYWANRHDDFNQVIISKRMISDHSMMEMVDVLSNIHLTGRRGNSSPMVFYSSMNITEEDAEGDEDTDIRLFMCCSNPDGKFPIALSLLAAVSLGFSGKSMTLCKFFSRESKFSVNEEKVTDIPVSIGLFSYSLMISDNATENVIASKYCVPYHLDRDNDWHMQASRAFAFLVVLFGCISFLLLCISTCFPLRRWAWKFITCMFLLTSLFQGLVFLMNQSDLCTNKDLDHGVPMEIESECHIDEGATEAIIAVCLYFLAAIGSMHFARSKIKQCIDEP